MKITEKCNRQVLNEGRDSGMGFAVLKRVDDENYITVNPVSPCKDYLNEVVFTENTGYPTSGCGLVYSKVNDVFKEKTSFLTFKVQKTKNGDFYIENKTFEDYKKEVDDGYKNIENLINKYQRPFRFAPCKITPANDEYYLVEVDTRWMKSTYSVSLLTLLLRVGKNFKEKQSVVEFLLSVSNTSIDYTLINSCFKRILKVYTCKKLPSIKKIHIKNKKDNPSFSPHGLGILSWDEKYE